MNPLALAIVGVIGGIVREFCVVNYTKSVIRQWRLVGASITLGLGILDLSVLAALMLNRSLVVPIAYLVGETIGTYIWIGKRRGQLQDR